MAWRVRIFIPRHDVACRRAETLDALLYSHAARVGLQLSLDVHEAELAFANTAS